MLRLSQGTDRGSPLPASLYTINGQEVSTGSKPVVLPEGHHRLVYRGTDLAGNSATCSFNIQVQG